MSLGFSSISGVNQVSLCSIFSVIPSCELNFSRSAQFGVILPSLVTVTVVIHHQTTHENEVRHEQFLGLGPDILILHEMMIFHDRSLHMSGVLT